MRGELHRDGTNADTNDETGHLSLDRVPRTAKQFGKMYDLKCFGVFLTCFMFNGNLKENLKSDF